jgi:hypothetical protein
MVPAELREALAAEADREGVSLEEIAAAAVAAHLEAARARKHFEDLAGRADPEWLMRFLERDGGLPPQEGDELPDGYQRTR